MIQLVPPTTNYTFNNLEVEMITEYLEVKPYKEVRDLMSIFLGRVGTPIGVIAHNQRNDRYGTLSVPIDKEPTAPEQR